MEQQDRQAAESIGTQAVNKIEEAKSKAVEVAKNAQRQGREKLESGKNSAAERTDKLAEVLEKAAQELGSAEQQSLAGYAGQLSTSMRTLAENLRSKSIDELFRDTQELARKNPTAFFFGSVAAGVALSRFLKASGERSRATGNEADYPMPQSPSMPVRFEAGAAVSPTVSSLEFGDDVKKGI